MDYFTSDTHFGHRNIIEYCKRPFASVDEMNAEMIRRWNSVVSADDTVYHLGDFAMGSKNLWAGYRRALNGRIVFICGNHDEPRERWRREVLQPGDEEYEDYFYPCSWGICHLSHIPPGGDVRRGFQRAGGEPPDGQASYFLCGHVHDAWRRTTYRERHVVNVGVDVWDFTPQKLRDILGEPVFIGGGPRIYEGDYIFAKLDSKMV